ncbi:hypothetical protein GCM10023347_40380 [Streptomyces chumphonensis]
MTAADGLGGRLQRLSREIEAHLGGLGRGASRVSYRFREFRIAPDEEPDAEDVMFAAQCAVCGECGRPGTDPSGARQWIVRHLSAHPEHYSYRELVSRPYRAVPGAWR